MEAPSEDAARALSGSMFKPQPLANGLMRPRSSAGNRKNTEEKSQPLRRYIRADWHVSLRAKKDGGERKNSGDSSSIDNRVEKGRGKRGVRYLHGHQTFGHWEAWKVQGSC